MRGAFRATLGILFVALVAEVPLSSAEEYFDGRVVRVIDGDGIEVLVGKTTREIRLAGIDAPERRQPWFQRAKQALSERVFGKEVRVNAVTIDKYGRTVGEVYADNVCVNCELVREGHAWIYRDYPNDSVPPELEAEARANRRGLWALPEADRVPPWEWRHGEANARKDRRQPHRVVGDFACGEKRYCREMASCEEAHFHLAECGLGRLDGDGDGVPCEAICE